MRNPIILPAVSRHNAGLATVEWLVATFAVTTLLWVVITASQWFTVRQHLMLHAQRAAEHAAMLGGKPQTAYLYLFHNLRPKSLRLGRVCVLDQVEDLIKDFKDMTLSRQLGHDVIRHSHIAAQQQKNQARGWREGRGPHSRKTISQANLLNMSVRAYQPINLLWLRPILGREIPVTVHVQTVMQSSRESLDWHCAGY